MRWAVHVTCVGEAITQFWSQDLKGIDHSEYLGVGEKNTGIDLKVRRCGVDASGSG
jgi:hypothetical protein